MKKADAKRAVIRFYEIWKSNNDSTSAAAPLIFYGVLQKERPELLDFRCSGDKYQVIAAWLNNPYGR
jgi:hypothetical protein